MAEAESTVCVNISKFFAHVYFNVLPKNMKKSKGLHEGYKEILDLEHTTAIAIAPKYLNAMHTFFEKIGTKLTPSEFYEIFLSIFATKGQLRAATTDKKRELVLKIISNIILSLSDTLMSREWLSILSDRSSPDKIASAAEKLKDLVRSIVNEESQKIHAKMRHEKQDSSSLLIELNQLRLRNEKLVKLLQLIRKKYTISDATLRKLQSDTQTVSEPIRSDSPPPDVMPTPTPTPMAPVETKKKKVSIMISPEHESDEDDEDEDEVDDGDVSDHEDDMLNPDRVF